MRNLVQRDLRLLCGGCRAHRWPACCRTVLGWSSKGFFTSAKAMQPGDGKSKFQSLSNSHAYIALGSNVGDRIGNIEEACRELDHDGLIVTRTSALYETAPMYFTKQDAFVNGVCEVAKSLELGPLELLKRLKSIEQRMGRHKTITNGPRNIDLDILLCGMDTIQISELNVPHKDMLEREFVLRPLTDLLPRTSHPGFPGLSYERRLSLLARSENDASMPSITMLSSRIAPLSPSHPTRGTQLMGVINLTPDSFSDGGQHLGASELLLSTCKSMVAAGAVVLDIGGQSTRPHAPQVSADEEAARILPTITMLRSQPEFEHVAISVDTYRASVARAAVSAGADIVNDVSGGMLDPEMLPTVAKLGCGLILMHMRGDPDNMVKQTDYSKYGDVVTGVAVELAERLEAAQRAGVRRWRIALDPGIGFAKSGVQNLELLRRFVELRSHADLKGYPWLVGVSRKSFLGRITGVSEPKERTWATAAAVTAAVQGGADMIRVHDVPEMNQVVKVADAIWRS